jgi:hypothetical protein
VLRRVDVASSHFIPSSIMISPLSRSFTSSAIDVSLFLGSGSSFKRVSSSNNISKVNGLLDPGPSDEIQYSIGMKKPNTTGQ